jgi:hypothetical protein
MTSRSPAYATVSRIVLINCGLPHGCSVYWELSLVQEIPELPLDAVADGTCINEDHNIAVGLFGQPVDALDNRSLDVGVIFRRLSVERSVEPGGRDPLVRNVGGKGEINWPSLPKSYLTSESHLQRRHTDIVAYRDDAVGQYTINLDVGVIFSGKAGLRKGKLFCGSQVRVKPAHVSR